MSVCPLCAGPAQSAFAGATWQLHPASRAFRYLDCPSCCLLFCDPRPTEAELTEVYANHYDYQWFADHAALKRVQARHRAARVEALLHGIGQPAPRTMLDVGCGHGWFVDAMSARGVQAVGVDQLGPDALAEVQRLGISYVNSRFEEADLGGRTFDLVTLWHSLEHVLNPGQVLSRVASLLAPGGVCLVAVPNRQAAGLRILGKKWGWLQPPYIHPWCFSAQAISQLAAPSLETRLVTSRDTWDQQTSETLPPYRWVELGSRVAFREPAKLLARAGAPVAARLLRGAYFAASESARLAAYAPYEMAHRGGLAAAFERGLHGAELNVILGAPQAPG